MYNIRITYLYLNSKTKNMILELNKKENQNFAILDQAANQDNHNKIWYITFDNEKNTSEDTIAIFKLKSLKHEKKNQKNSNRPGNRNNK